jgi:hypothetical protein
MKNTFTYILIALILSACNVPVISEKQEKMEPQPEMIFGKDKKELEAYNGFLDSLYNVCSDLKIDTTLFQNGSFIIYDSLELTNSTPSLAIAISRRGRHNKDGLIVRSRFDLNDLLEGKVKLNSYEDYLNKLKETKYLVTFKDIVYTKPHLVNNRGFAGGTIVSYMQVVDIEKKIVVKVRLFQVENSNEIKTLSGLAPSERDLIRDLWNNYSSNRIEIIENVFN